MASLPFPLSLPRLALLTVALLVGTAVFFPGAVALDTIDSDNDGLSDHAELLTYQSDRTDSDTDGDGLSDGTEVRTHGTDPTSVDTDNDNLTDSAELDEYDTDPLDPDTDRDKLSDGEEVHTYGTDPHKQDTDGDGFYDSEEVNGEELFLGSGPKRAFTSDPTLKDTDRDGLPDRQEVMKYRTNVSNPDTDSDGVLDGAELNFTTNNRHNSPLDPHTRDTDEDGYSDYYSVTRVSDLNSSVDRVHLQKPFDTNDFSGPDSDGDGFPDRVERQNSNLSADTKDVVVRVIWTEGQAPRAASLLNVVDAFADSPVDNNNGIRLHFYIDKQVDAPSTVSDLDYSDGPYSELSVSDNGMHNALYVTKIRHNGRAVNGLASQNYPAFVVANATTHSRGANTMHELGHSLGLFTFDGIDSKKYAVEDYPSVMNYNSACFSYGPGCYRYSHGAGQNDWGVIEQLLEDGRTTPTGSYKGS
jgi:hypothetical protein